MAMSGRRAKKQLTRGATVELKAARLSGILDTVSPPPITPDETLDDDSSSEPAATVTESSAAGGAASPRDALNDEIRALRKQLAEKTAAYHLLTGGGREVGSQTVAKVVAMLSEPAGATKSRLMAETGARKGYIDALLNRILPGRGHTISSFPVDGARVRGYRITKTAVVTE
jgi:hypothetical protein